MLNNILKILGIILISGIIINSIIEFIIENILLLL